MTKVDHDILIRKILVVVLDNLGDAVIATAVLRPLKRIYPRAKIGFWTKTYSAPLFEDHSLIDTVHASDPFWDTAPGQGKGTLADFRSTWSDIKKEGYDVALILNTEWRRALSCWWAKIPVRVGFKRRKSQLFLTNGFSAVEEDTPKVSEHRHLLEEWAEIKLPSDVWVPRVERTGIEKNWATEWRDNQKWKDNPIVVFHPFAGDPKKCWPVEKWFGLFRALSAKFNNLRFVFACTEAESFKLRAELTMVPKQKCAVVAATYVELKGLLGETTMFIGGDSGPGHVAAAMGVPVLSLFGPSDPIVYGPTGRNIIKVLKQDDLSDLSVDKVSEETNRILKGLLQTSKLS